MNGHHASPPRAAILAVPLVVAVVLTLFAWPAARMEPRDLPIGVAGAPAGAEAIERRLAQQEGAFDVHRYAGEPGARRAIEDREVYGAFVATPEGPRVLTASAASPAVAQLISRAAAEQGAAGGRGAPAGSGGSAAAPQATPVEVDDVVPAPSAASGLGASVLPLVLAGLVTGAVGVALASSGARRAGFVVAGSVLAGLTATVIVQSWLGVIEGDWIVNAGALSLTVLAIAAPVAGAAALFGKVGAALAALVMVLIGNPFSGVGSAPELLPEPAGAIGQLLPPGAGGNLLRGTGFFDGAAAGKPLVVLGTWAVVGLVALLVAPYAARHGGRSTQPHEAASGAHA